MPFLIIAFDHPDQDAQREAVREAHRAHLAALGDRLLASGALLADDGVSIIGGASLIDTESEEEARCFEQDDPYARAGIRASVQVVRWRLRWWCGEFQAGGWRPSEGLSA